MGASASVVDEELERKQNDIAYLGDRFPFGDAELSQLYRVYQQLQSNHTGPATSKCQGAGTDNSHSKSRSDETDNTHHAATAASSFLKEAGLLSYQDVRRRKTKEPNPTPKQGEDGEAEAAEQAAAEAKLCDERLCLLEAVERKILPRGFGNRLYQTCFLRATEVSEYDEESKNTNTILTTIAPEDEDEYTRIARLEKFFEGLANGTRRDRKTVTQCLIKCCQQHLPPPPSPSHTENATSAAPAATDTFAYGGGTNRNSHEQEHGQGREPQNRSYIDPVELINLGYRLCLAAAFLKEAGECSDNEEYDVGRFLPPTAVVCAPGLTALSNSLSAVATKRKQRQIRSTVPTDQQLTLVVDDEDIHEWVEQVAPMFGAILPTFLHCIFFPNKRAPPTRTTFDYPRISQESTIFPYNSSPLLFSFGCMSPALSGEFYRLYTSASDGLSFNRLMNALLGYGGPTLLIIQSGKSTFGAFTASPWKESKDFYGNHACFLYRLLPERTAVYRPSGGTSKASNRFMYCNSFARSRGYDQQAHGIGFGGSTDSPRLFLSESFDDCRAGSDDLTFENGPLLAVRDGGSAADALFYIDNCEVWGVGGTDVVQESLKARGRSRDIRQATLNKARKVDKAAFLDDMRSGLIGNKNFAHREQIQGRDGTCELTDGDGN